MSTEDTHNDDADAHAAESDGPETPATVGKVSADRVEIVGGRLAGSIATSLEAIDRSLDLLKATAPLRPKAER